MKIPGVLLAIFALAAGAGRAAPDSAGPFPRAELAEGWGWRTARDQNLAGVELSAAERAVFLEGAASQLRGEPAPAEVGRAFPDVERLARARGEKLRRATVARRRAEAGPFFAALRQRPGVAALGGGAYYEVLRRGQGAPLRERQMVRLHYTGRLLDGSEFTQLGPYDVVLVPLRLGPALFAGVARAERGGAVRLYVPPGGAGDEAALGIPPGAATVFDLEVLEVRDATPEELTDSLLPPAPEPPPPPPSGLPERQLIRTWGWIAARTAGVAALQLGAEAEAAFVRGFDAGLAGSPAPAPWPKLGPAVDSFLAAERARVREAALAGRRADMAAFFAGLKRNSAVVELPDGLRYEVVSPGHGPYPRPGEIVLVNYTGRLLDGTVFDRTDNEPLHIEVGSVVPGWNEGIQRINRGGRIKLYLPPDLGYGEENASGVLSSIPGGSAIIYDIQLLDIQAAPPK